MKSNIDRCDEMKLYIDFDGVILDSIPVIFRILEKTDIDETDEKELTITKNRVEILRMMFATASCNSPKCSIATKNRNHGATLINE